MTQNVLKDGIFKATGSTWIASLTHSKKKIIIGASINYSEYLYAHISNLFSGNSKFIFCTTCWYVSIIK